jgi:hypothetical protein
MTEEPHRSRRKAIMKAHPEVSVRILPLSIFQLYLAILSNLPNDAQARVRAFQFDLVCLPRMLFQIFAGRLILDRGAVLHLTSCPSLLLSDMSSKHLFRSPNSWVTNHLRNILFSRS